MNEVRCFPEAATGRAAIREGMADGAHVRPGLGVPIVFGLTLAVWGCGGARGTAAPSVTTPPEQFSDSALGTGDVFEVRVFGEGDLSGKYRVDPEGTIDFPLVGRTEVAGLLPSEVASSLRDALKTQGYLRDPQVSVFVEEYVSKQISVLGAVARPGTFPVTPGMTAVQAISLAGGFTPLASRDQTRITRRADGQVVRFRVDVEDITTGRTPDPPVRPGDMIFVPERIF